MVIIDTIVIEKHEESQLMAYQTEGFKVLETKNGKVDPEKIFATVEISEMNDFVEAIYQLGASTTN